jgi:hypothetical protein
MMFEISMKKTFGVDIKFCVIKIENKRTWLKYSKTLLPFLAEFEMNIFNKTFNNNCIQFGIALSAHF